MEAEINRIFERISRKLFRESLNYCASFKLFTCDRTRSCTLENLAQSALGDQVLVGGSSEATEQEVIEELKNALSFRGDHGAHPSLDYLDSPDSKKDFDLVISYIQKILDRSIRVVAIWLKDGHPFYPVFWDFAFLIETNEETILFIASSSD